MHLAYLTCKVKVGRIMPAVNISHNFSLRQRRVRAGFLLQGTSLNSWCKEAGIARQNADQVLLGQWKGPKASALMVRILAAAGVEE